MPPQRQTALVCTQVPEGRCHLVLDNLGIDPDPCGTILGPKLLLLAHINAHLQGLAIEASGSAMGVVVHNQRHQQQVTAHTASMRVLCHRYLAGAWSLLVTYRGVVLEGVATTGGLWVAKHDADLHRRGIPAPLTMSRTRVQGPFTITCSTLILLHNTIHLMTQSGFKQAYTGAQTQRV
jgi:hypothetical protein